MPQNRNFRQLLSLTLRVSGFSGEKVSRKAAGVQNADRKSAQKHNIICIKNIRYYLKYIENPVWHPSCSSIFS
jgi:hypothetical protein